MAEGWRGLARGHPEEAVLELSTVRAPGGSPPCLFPLFSWPTDHIQHDFPPSRTKLAWQQWFGFVPLGPAGCGVMGGVAVGSLALTPAPLFILAVAPSCLISMALFSLPMKCG